MRYEEFADKKDMYEKRIKKERGLVDKLNEVTDLYNKELSDITLIPIFSIKDSNSNYSEEQYSLTDLNLILDLLPTSELFRNNREIDNYLEEWSLNNDYLTVKFFYKKEKDTYGLKFSLKEGNPIPFYLLGDVTNQKDFEDMFFHLLSQTVHPTIAKLGHYHILDLIIYSVRTIKGKDTLAEVFYNKKFETYFLEYKIGHVSHTRVFDVSESWNNTVCKQISEYEKVVTFYENYIPHYKKIVKSLAEFMSILFKFKNNL